LDEIRRDYTIVIKRKLLMTLVRYVGQSWSHEYLHILSKTEISSGLKRQDNSAITLESFLGILTPLLYRNEEIFLSVFKAHLRVFEHGRVLMVGLKDVLISLPLFLD